MEEVRWIFSRSEMAASLLRRSQERPAGPACTAALFLSETPRHGVGRGRRLTIVDDGMLPGDDRLEAVSTAGARQRARTVMVGL